MAQAPGGAVCPRCRVAVRPEARFCHRCGQALDASAAERGARPVSGRGLREPTGPPEERARRKPGEPRTALVPLLALAIMTFLAALAGLVLGDLRIGLVILGAGVLVTVVALVIGGFFDGG